METKNDVTNIVISGLGGQGVLKASDILSEAVFIAGFDIKKAEIHGMSQRGGSVTSDVRFGAEVLSPMVPVGEADFLVVLEPTQLECSRHYLRPGGVLLESDRIDPAKLQNRRSLNVAMLGALSAHLEIERSFWETAICANLPEKLHAVNMQAFELGRSTVSSPPKTGGVDSDGS
jgi:indolepyruvate ferredoxin oxidoreductase, beta subunit